MFKYRIELVINFQSYKIEPQSGRFFIIIDSVHHAGLITLYIDPVHDVRLLYKGLIYKYSLLS